MNQKLPLVLKVGQAKLPSPILSGQHHPRNNKKPKVNSEKKEPQEKRKPINSEKRKGNNNQP